MTKTTIGQSLVELTEEIAKELAAPEGVVYHAIESGLTVHDVGLTRGDRFGISTGRVLDLGDELVVDDALLTASRDSLGGSAFDDLSDDGQRESWGRVFLREGPLESNPELQARLEAAREAERVQRQQERVRGIRQTSRSL